MKVQRLILVCLSVLGSQVWANDELANTLNEANHHHLRGDIESSLSLGRSLQLKYPSELAGYVHNLNVLTTSLSWDEDNRSFDQDIEQLGRKISSGCESGLPTPPVLLACGQGNFSLSYLYGVRGKSLSAGRAAKKAKLQLDLALKSDPGLTEAKLHIGLINYYSENLPPFAQFVGRLLSLVPRSEPERGLAFVEQAATGESLFADSARFVLSDLLRQENQPARALLLLTDLVDRYPKNQRLRYNLIELMLDMNQSNRAADELAKLNPSIKRAPQFVLLEARAALAQGDIATVENLMASWTKDAKPKWVEDQYQELKFKAMPQWVSRSK